MSNTTGAHNTASGVGALQLNTNGDDNTASGSGALSDNNTGADNTAVGSQTLASNTTGNLNTAVGFPTASNIICIGADGQNVSNSCYIEQIFGATSGGGIAVHCQFRR